jgi:hypothetical protein
MKLKIYWENSCPDNAQNDWEYYNMACWTDRLDVQEVDSKNIRKIFDEQDGDCDFTHSILMVTDDRNEILWRRHKHSNEEYDYKLEQFFRYAEKIDQWNQIEVKNRFR